MKHSIFTYAVICAGMFMGFASTSCSEDTKIDGSWIGTQERLFLNEKSLADCEAESRFTFTPDADDASHGNVSIVTDLTIQDAVPSNDSIVSSYEITVTGSSKISGTYVFTNDDEITVNLDSKTLQINIDPDGVVFASNVFTGQQEPQVEPLSRTELAGRYERQLRMAVAGLYDRYHRIDEIKISHNIMACEIADHDYSFRRADVQPEK